MRASPVLLALLAACAADPSVSDDPIDTDVADDDAPEDDCRCDEPVDTGDTGAIDTDAPTDTDPLDTDACDPHQAAVDYVSPNVGTEDVFVELATESEAMAYADPDGASVVWLVPEGTTSTVAAWVWGRNDSWAVRFDVDVDTCAITVTGEH